MPDRLRYLAAIDRGRAALVAGARAAGLDAAVPCSGRWRVRDLVIHTGNVHAWASQVVVSGAEQPQAFDAIPDGVGPGVEELLRWYDEQAALLLGLLDPETGIDDDRDCWTFGPPGTVRFWPRRQAHEVTMHAVDAQLAAGAAMREVVTSLDAELAADGVDEVLTVMMPRVAAFVPRPALPGRLALRAEDTDHEWLLEADGQIASAAANLAPIATLAGPAAALFTVLWRRASLPADGAELDVHVEGDGAAVEALFAARLTP